MWFHGVHGDVTNTFVQYKVYARIFNCVYVEDISTGLVLFHPYICIYVHTADVSWNVHNADMAHSGVQAQVQMSMMRILCTAM
jgi:hypothetical protein